MQRSLWDFSNAVYAAAGVAEECLGLQDRCGIDVNLLLFCGYMGAGGVLLSQDDLRQVSELLRAWHEDVVRPLRAARRALKIRYGFAFMPVVGPTEDLRGKVKAAELEAERIEQAVLEQWAAQRSGQFAVAGAGQAIDANIRLLLEMADVQGAPALARAVMDVSTAR